MKTKLFKAENYFNGLVQLYLTLDKFSGMILGVMSIFLKAIFGALFKSIMLTFWSIIASCLPVRTG